METETQQAPGANKSCMIGSVNPKQNIIMQTKWL